jgi:acetyl-CoA carboxylase carboxyltransferase component
MTPSERIERELARVRRGGADEYHQKNTEEGKLFARERRGFQPECTGAEALPA